MAFGWVEDISVGATIDATDINEIKTNIDTIYTYRSITRNGCGSGAGWSELPVSVGEVIESADIQELRDAADYAQENICGIDNSGYHINEYQTAKGSVCGTYVAAENSGDEGSNNSDEYYQYHDVDYGAFCTIVHSTYCSGENSTEYTGYGDYCFTVNLAYEVTVYGSD